MSTHLPCSGIRVWSPDFIRDIGTRWAWLGLAPGFA